MGRGGHLFDGQVDEIHRDSESKVTDMSPAIEMKTMEEIEEERLREEEKLTLGHTLLTGNMVESKSQGDIPLMSKELWDESVLESIRERVCENLNSCLASQTEYSSTASKVFMMPSDEKYQTLQKELEGLASSHNDRSLSKRKKELSNATVYFAKIDEAKKKLDKEKDPNKRLKLSLEIVDLKSQALISRARALSKSETDLADEIANIGIAANYERIELLKRKMESDREKIGEDSKEEKMAASDVYLQSVKYGKKIASLEEGVEKIAESRKRMSARELFSAAYKKRREELKDLGEGGIAKADIERNQRRSEKLGQIFSSEDTELSSINEEVVDLKTEESDDEEIREEKEATLKIERRMEYFKEDVESCIKYIKEGKPLLQDHRSMIKLNLSQANHMCKSFLLKYDHGLTDNETSKICISYVKKIEEKTSEYLNEKKDNFFLALQAILIDYRKHSAYSSEEKDDSVKALIALGKSRGILDENGQEKTGL